MQSVCMWLLISVLVGVGAAAAQAPPPQSSPPTIHRTACSLGESMASKLSSQNVTPETAQRTCQQLAADMNAADHTEFMRCCTARLLR